MWKSENSGIKKAALFGQPLFIYEILMNLISILVN